MPLFKNQIKHTAVYLPLFLLCAISVQAIGSTSVRAASETLKESAASVEATKVPSGVQTKQRSGQKPSAPVPVGSRLKVVPAEGGEAGQNRHTIEGTATAGLPQGMSGRNPFSTTGRMTSQPATGGYANRYGLDFTPSEQPGGVPKMHLRGLLRGDKGKSVALLEIEGSGVHMVSEGDFVSLQDLGIDKALQIKKIGRLHVVVEAGSPGLNIMVH